FSGVVDVLTPPEDTTGTYPLAPRDAAQMAVEQIVEADDDLMNRYLEGETLTSDELRDAAHRAIALGKLVPIVCVSSRKDVGLKELLALLPPRTLNPSDVHPLPLP